MVKLGENSFAVSYPTSRIQLLCGEGLGFSWAFFISMIEENTKKVLKTLKTIKQVRQLAKITRENENDLLRWFAENNNVPLASVNHPVKGKK